jgi:hypothetical protein
MALHDLSYQHYDGLHKGIWSRRWVIASNSLKGCLNSKWMRHIITMCWGLCLTQAFILFMIGQLLVKDSVIVNWVGNAGTHVQTFVSSLTTWLAQHPEISVRTTQNLLFYFFSMTILETLSLVAIALAIPHLICRDLSSNAIIIYSSKAVTRFDYFLGKFMAIMCLLFLTWLGPVIVSWFVGNLLAPNWGFFWHSKVPLAHSFLYITIGMVFLSLLAMGVSSTAIREKFSVSNWIALWLIGNALVDIGRHTKPWLKFLSFRYDLDQVGRYLFDMSHELQIAQDNVPLFGQVFQSLRKSQSFLWDQPDLTGAIFAMSIMLIIATSIVYMKVKPE